MLERDIIKGEKILEQGSCKIIKGVQSHKERLIVHRLRFRSIRRFVVNIKTGGFKENAIFGSGVLKYIHQQYTFLI